MKLDNVIPLGLFSYQSTTTEESLIEYELRTRTAHIPIEVAPDSTGIDI